MNSLAPLTSKKGLRVTALGKAAQYCACLNAQGP